MSKNRLLFVSLRSDAGKTSMILGLAKTAKKRCGYIKPFGDRLLYKKKRLWDHDAALLSKALELKEDLESMTLGFDHAKLKYMYDSTALNEKLNQACLQIESDNDFLVIEGGRDLAYGSSINLNAEELAKAIGAKMVVVVHGAADSVADDLTFLKRHVDLSNIAGVIINKIQDIEDFKNTHLEYLNTLGINILGMIPYDASLEELSIRQICDTLLAKVIAGNDRLDNRVSHIDVGAMSINEIVKNNIFNKKNNLIITSGDRVDIILAALDCEPAGIILTNNILPPAHVIIRAGERDVPLMTVPTNTFTTAKKVDDIEPLLMPQDDDKFQKLEKLVAEYLDINDFLT